MVKRLTVLLLLVPALLGVAAGSAAALDSQVHVESAPGRFCADPEECQTCPGVWLNGQWHSLCL